MAEKKRRNKGEFAVVVVCIIVGYLLAAQLRTVQLTGAADATNASRLETLQHLYNEQSEQNDALEDQVAQLQSELAIYRDQAASGDEGGEALRQELEQLEIAAGRTDVEGRHRDPGGLHPEQCDRRRGRLPHSRQRPALCGQRAALRRRRGHLPQR